MILSNFLSNPSKGILSIAYKILFPTHRALNHSHNTQIWSPLTTQSTHNLQSTHQYENPT